MHHLSISCPFATRMLHMTFNLHPPTSITNMFDNWLRGGLKQKLKHVTMWMFVLCFGLFGTVVTIVFFNRVKVHIFLQIIFHAT